MQVSLFARRSARDSTDTPSTGSPAASICGDGSNTRSISSAGWAGLRATRTNVPASRRTLMSTPVSAATSGSRLTMLRKASCERKKRSASADSRWWRYTPAKAAPPPRSEPTCRWHACRTRSSRGPTILLSNVTCMGASCAFRTPRVAARPGRAVREETPTSRARARGSAPGWARSAEYRQAWQTARHRECWLREAERPSNRHGPRANGRQGARADPPPWHRSTTENMAARSRPAATAK